LLKKDRYRLNEDFQSLFQHNATAFGLTDQQFLFASIKAETAVSWMVKAMGNIYDQMVEIYKQTANLLAMERTLLVYLSSMLSHIFFFI
jgi:hypothetical protein